MPISSEGVRYSGQLWLYEAVIHRIVKALRINQCLQMVCLRIGRHTGPVRTAADLVVQVPTRAGLTADTVATEKTPIVIASERGAIVRRLGMC